MTTLPNILTYARIVVIPLLLVTFYDGTESAQLVASALFLVAAITDFFDGHLARRRNQVTRLGMFLDPIADKLLVASVLLMLIGFNRISEISYIPAVTILCREILVSGLREFLAEVQVSIPVSRLAKWKTAMQLIALTWLLLVDAVPVCFYVRTVGEAILWIAAILTMLTGYDYLKAGLTCMQTVPKSYNIGSIRENSRKTSLINKNNITNSLVSSEYIAHKVKKVLIVAGYSGSGKTTLICSLIPLLNAYGLTVSTFKHTHHDIDSDPPGKDSRRHRETGAHEVMLVGPKRAVTVSEWRTHSVPSLPALLSRLQPVDLVIIEGLSLHTKNYPKIEVWRAAIGKPRVLPGQALLAVAMIRKDAAATQTVDVPVLDLDDPGAVADFLVDRLGLLSRTRKDENSLLCVGESKNWPG